MTEPLSKLIPSIDALLEFYQANLEAVAQAQAAFAKGLQDLSTELAAQTQSQLDITIATYKAALTAKTPAAVTELQIDQADAARARFLASTSKLGEIGLQMSRDALAPLNARVAAAAKLAKTTDEV